MTNDVVQVEVRIEANAAIGHVSKKKLPKSGTDFESEDIGIHCEKKKWNLFVIAIVELNGLMQEKSYSPHFFRLHRLNMKMRTGRIS